MKNVPLVVFGLLLSLAANLALGLVLLRPSAPGGRTDTPPQTIAATSTAATASPDAPPAGVVPTGTLLWDCIGSTDHAKLIDNLRKAGFTPKQIRAIARFLVEEKYRARMVDVYSGGKDTPYWKTSNFFYTGDKTVAERRKLQREMTNDIKALVGDSYSMVDEMNEPYLKNQFGNLSTEKIDKLMRIQQDYGDLRGDLGMGNAMLPADREKLALLEKEQRSDIEKLLTADELFEYDLRSSTAAFRVKGNQNELLNLTETEYRSLFPIFQSIEKQLPANAGSNYQEVQKAREAAEAKIQDQIQAALGEARYADYKQAHDRTAAQENRLVSRLGLPLATAGQLVEVKKEYLDLTKSINTDKVLTTEQKREQIAVLTKDSEARVTSLIGERGLTAYREYGGQWLQSATTTRVTPTELPPPASR